jgi:hypothetical protein
LDPDLHYSQNSVALELIIDPWRAVDAHKDPDPHLNGKSWNRTRIRVKVMRIATLVKSKKINLESLKGTEE